MGKGIAYLLLKDRYLEGIQFYEHMAPIEYGDEFYEKFEKVKDEKEFRECIETFYKRLFEYPDDSPRPYIYEFSNSDFYDVMARDELIVDFNNNYSSRFCSDWIFIKNLTGSKINIITTGDIRGIKNEDFCEDMNWIIPNGNSCKFYKGRSMSIEKCPFE